MFIMFIIFIMFIMFIIFIIFIMFIIFIIFVIFIIFIIQNYYQIMNNQFNKMNFFPYIYITIKNIINKNNRLYMIK